MIHPQTAQSIKRDLTQQFREAGLPFASEDARQLILSATGFTDTELITRGAEPLPADVVDLILEYAAHRLSGQPVDHILGERFFYDLPFTITRDVLSPRSDTEVLVREGLRLIHDVNAPHILDMGTGSGAILISLLHARKDASGVGVDISPQALAVAKDNAKRHDICAKWVCGSWFAPLEKGAEFDLIISNPPYITDAAMAGLDADVRDYDPHLALAGGDDGLAAYRQILGGACKYLARDGWLAVEIGFDQGPSVLEMYRTGGFRQITLVQDLGGLDRVVLGQCPRVSTTE